MISRCYIAKNSRNNDVFTVRFDEYVRLISEYPKMTMKACIKSNLNIIQEKNYL